MPPHETASLLETRASMTPRSDARTPLRTLTLALLLALSATPSQAQDADRARPEPRRPSLLERLRAQRGEWRLELKLAAAQLRGTLEQGLHKLEPSWKPATHGRGSLSLGPGGLPILRLKGSPEEMGEQHGVLLKDQIRVLMQIYVPAFLGSDLDSARREAKAFLPHISERHRRELRALAKASGQTFGDVLLGHCFPDQYRAWGCSCVTATGAARGAAGPLFGRNLDFIDMGFLHRFSLIVIFEPDQGPRFVSLTFPGMIGVISGLNEWGLASAVMVVHSGGCKPGTPFGLLFRGLLETQRDTAGVGAQLASAAITVGNNLMVCDAKGAARVFELNNSEPRCVARGPDSRGLLFSTNHHASPTNKRTRLSAVFLSSRRRYQQLEDCCAGDGPVTLETIKQGLEDTAPKIANVQSMVFAPATRELHVAFGRKPAAAGRLTKLGRSLLFPLRNPAKPQKQEPKTP